MIILMKSAMQGRGGLEKYTWQIAYALLERGMPVTLLTSGSPRPPREDPRLRIVSFDTESAWSFQSVRRFDNACRAYCARYPEAIVFGLDRNRFQTHLRAGNGVHAAYLNRRGEEEGWLKQLSFSLNPLHKILLSVEKESFEHPGLKKLFTNSFLVRQEVLTHYDVDPRKIHVVHNGVEWEALEEPFTASEGKQNEVPELLFVGHNFYRKGLHKLLSALEFIQEEPFQLRVVGRDRQQAHFEQLVAKKGLQSKVHFYGAAPSLPFYKKADLLIIPSLYDPFANVTVEGLAMGLFVLSSIHNGGCEVLTPDTGALIPQLDNAAAFGALIRHSLKQRRSRAVRESVRHLDFSKQLPKLVEGLLS